MQIEDFVTCIASAEGNLLLRLRESRALRTRHTVPSLSLPDLSEPKQNGCGEGNAECRRSTHKRVRAIRSARQTLLGARRRAARLARQGIVCRCRRSHRARGLRVGRREAAPGGVAAKFKAESPGLRGGYVRTWFTGPGTILELSWFDGAVRVDW